MNETIRTEGRELRRNLVPLVLGIIALVLTLLFRSQLIAWFTGGDHGGDPGEAAASEVGDMALSVAPDPDTPRKEDNGLAIELRDAEGKPITGAKIVATLTMPAMGAMPEMRTKAKVIDAGDGRYRATYDLAMDGTWTLAVEAAADQGSIEATYSLTVGTPGLRALSSTGTEATARATAGGGDEIDHYTCSMHSSVHQKQPGKCPICGMTLVPVTKQEVKTGILRVDKTRRQLIGLKTAPARRRLLTKTVRAVGRVVYDDTKIADVTVRLGGFIRDLTVEAMGQKVRRGQRLFSIYSPDLYTAQREYLLALSQKEAAASEAGRNRAKALLVGARQRLLLWQFSPKQLEALARRGKPLEYLAVTAPASGYVVEKNVVEGAAVQAGQRLFRIANLDDVWVEAEVYEEDLGQVAVGQKAAVTMTHMPGKKYQGEVSFIYPYLDGASRTARVRIELPNRGLELKPDMYADVELTSEIGERLAIPESAVIYSGPRRIVFVDLGDGKLQPRVIEVGVKTDGYFEVTKGLEDGDLVVTSGNFLISAESRLKAATGLW